MQRGFGFDRQSLIKSEGKRKHFNWEGGGEIVIEVNIDNQS